MPAASSRRLAHRRRRSALVNGHAGRRDCGLPSIVVTLAMLAILRDGLRWTTEGAWVGDLPAAFQWFGLGPGGWADAASSAHAVVSIVAGRLGPQRASPPGAPSTPPAATRVGAISRACAPTRRDRRALRRLRPAHRPCGGAQRRRFAEVPGAVIGGLEMKVIAAVDRRRHRDPRRPRIHRRHRPRRRAARHDRHGPDIPRRQRVLGASPAGRDHPRGDLPSDRADRRPVTRGQRMTARAPQRVDAGGRVWRWRSRSSAPIAPNFATAGNAAEIVRLAVEVGLLALALTPIVIAGGIDLSCGRAARARGHRARRAVARCRLAVWLAGGSGALARRRRRRRAQRVAHRLRWRLPALMVTLGSLSLFRGLAEGLTGAVDNYTGLPPSLPVARARASPGDPRQAPVLLLVALGTSACCSIARPAAASTSRSARTPRPRGFAGHQSLRPAGRALRPVGTGRRARRYHLRRPPRAGQGRRGHRLRADGDHGRRARRRGDHRRRRARSGGTMLGLLAMVVLQNGLRLAALPAELAGILTGVLLMGALIWRLACAQDELAPRFRSHAGRAARQSDEMRNSQLAVLCGVILARRAASSPRRTGGWCARCGPRRPTRDAAGGGCRRRPTSQAVVVGHDAQGQGRSVLRQLPQGRRGSGGAV